MCSKCSIFAACSASLPGAWPVMNGTADDVGPMIPNRQFERKVADLGSAGLSPMSGVNRCRTSCAGANRTMSVAGHSPILACPRDVRLGGNLGNVPNFGRRQPETGFDPHCVADVAVFANE